MDLAQYLEKQNAAEIAAKFGFKDGTYVEKLVVDFFIAGIIQERLDCTIRGGMCMPLHTEGRLHRLSIDIDFIAKGGVREIGAAMDGIAEDVKEIEITKMNPKNPYPVPNIASYDVMYRSRFGVKGRIKVDFLCGVDVEFARVKMPEKYEIFGFGTEHALNALDRPSLLADKITTLALGKIGLKESKLSEVPKQIYDVAALIRSCDAGELESALTAFPTLTKFKIGMYGAPYTAQDVAGTIRESVLDMLGFSGTISLSGKPLDWYHKFRQRYLQDSGEGYNKTHHIVDTMLVAVFARHLEKFLAGDTSPDASADRISHVVKALADMSEPGAGALVQANRDWSSPPFSPRILKACPPEVAFLAGEIWGAQGPGVKT